MALQRLTGLWIGEKEGRKYISGKVNEKIVIPAGATLLVYKNDRKQEGSRQPDYNISMISDDLPAQAEVESDELGF